jgi:hypothetical protein
MAVQLQCHHLGVAVPHLIHTEKPRGCWLFSKKLTAALTHAGARARLKGACVELFSELS